MENVLSAGIMKEFSHVEALDRVNYFGLIEGLQIMFCTPRKQGKYLILWCLQRERPQYGLSHIGEAYHGQRAFNNISHYIGQMTYIQVTNNNIDLWNELYKERLFPFWDPELGPLEYCQNNNRSIAICRVYRIKTGITNEDIGGGRIYRLITNVETKEQIINDLIEYKNPILEDEEFNDNKKRIMKIINEYQ